MTNGDCILAADKEFKGALTLSRGELNATKNATTGFSKYYTL